MGKDGWERGKEGLGMRLISGLEEQQHRHPEYLLGPSSTPLPLFELMLCPVYSLLKLFSGWNLTSTLVLSGWDHHSLK